MSKFNSTSLIVDDRDPSITYSSGWLKVSTTAEYDGTKSGANEAGMTATFVFTGVQRLFGEYIPVSMLTSERCRYWSRSLRIARILRCLRRASDFLRNRRIPRYPTRIYGPHHRPRRLHFPYTILPIRNPRGCRAYTCDHEYQRHPAISLLVGLFGVYSSEHYLSASKLKLRRSHFIVSDIIRPQFNVVVTVFFGHTFRTFSIEYRSRCREVHQIAYWSDSGRCRWRYCLGCGSCLSAFLGLVS